MIKIIAVNALGKFFVDPTDAERQKYDVTKKVAEAIIAKASEKELFDHKFIRIDEITNDVDLTSEERIMKSNREKAVLLININSNADLPNGVTTFIKAPLSSDMKFLNFTSKIHSEMIVNSGTRDNGIKGKIDFYDTKSKCRVIEINVNPSEEEEDFEGIAEAIIEVITTNI